LEYLLHRAPKVNAIFMPTWITNRGSINVGGKPAVPANDPYSSVFRASEIVLVIDLRNKSNFCIGLGVLQENSVELLMFS
jgi:hypothetical protein